MTEHAEFLPEQADNHQFRGGGRGMKKMKKNKEVGRLRHHWNLMRGVLPGLSRGIVIVFYHTFQGPQHPLPHGNPGMRHSNSRYRLNYGVLGGKPCEGFVELFPTYFCRTLRAAGK